jgi:peptidoglycan/LPS O-acetylase OafA/YrhL
MTDASDMGKSILDIPVNPGRSQNIDTLRFLLAVWVVVTHLVPWVFAVQGPAAIPPSMVWLTRELEALFQGSGETHPAVLGFIVLSGFCIHRNGLRGYREGVGRYAIRRLFRIYPVFFIAACFGFGMFYIASIINPGAVTSVSGTKELVLADMFKKLLTTEVLNPTDYLTSIQGNGPLQTVAAEMWLYAVYPLGLLVISRVSDIAWWIVVTGCFVATAYINTFMPEWRSWSFNASLMGLITFWWIGLKFTDKNFAHLITRFIWLPIGIWLTLTYFEKDMQAYEQLLAVARQIMLSLCFGCLIATIDKEKDTSKNPLSSLGSAGYSIYAFHAPIVYLMVLCGAAWWLIGLTAVAAGVTAFHLIEKPFMRIGRNLTRAGPSLHESAGSRAPL